MFAHTCIHKCSLTNGEHCLEDPRVERAKEFCDNCPVMDHCRWWSVVDNLLFGVAGGLTYAERLTIRKALRKDKFGSSLIKGEVEISWQ